MGGVVSAVSKAFASLFGACEKNENPAVEKIDKDIEERERREREERERKEREKREKKEREERERKEREEREKKEREERERERERERREMEAREENLRNEMAAKEAEIKRREENEAAMRKEHEKKEADLKRELDAQKAEMERDFAEQQAALQQEREAMEARIKREREDEEKKAMLAQEKLQKLQSEHDQLQAEKDNIEENWKNGIRPTERVTKEEFLAVKERYGYQNNMFHIAIAGIAGAGKSSLINAFLGVLDADAKAAGTGVVECTNGVTRYEGEPPLVWYDIPGAGTFDQPSWQYFNQQGLYIFDCIIVLFDNRFTETDASILRACKLVEPPIPTFIVRSKSDQHIDNEFKKRTEARDDLNAAAQAEINKECMKHYIEATRTNVRDNLRKIGLDENQPVYLVSQVNIKTFVRKLKNGELINSLVKTGEFVMNLVETGEFGKYLAQTRQLFKKLVGKSGDNVTIRAVPVLDEEDLIHDILSAGYTRRSQES